MRYIQILLLLVTLNWTALLGQTGKTDTVTCYTNSELRKIAIRMVQASEYDTLLDLSNQEIVKATEIIINQEQQIANLDTLIEHQDSIIAGYDSVLVIQTKNIEVLRNYSEKLQKDKKMLKSGWWSSTVVMIVITLLVAI